MTFNIIQLLDLSSESQHWDNFITFLSYQWAFPGTDATSEFSVTVGESFDIGIQGSAPYFHTQVKFSITWNNLFLVLKWFQNCESKKVLADDQPIDNTTVYMITDTEGRPHEFSVRSIDANEELVDSSISFGNSSTLR